LVTITWMKLARSTTRLTVAVLVLCGGAILAGPSRPDFSGTWKLNLTKSNLGPLPPPSAMTIAIVQKYPELEVNTKISGGPEGDLDYDATYATDGKETVNRLGGHDARSKAHWEGSTLAVETRADFGGGDVDVRSRWALSEGGKVLNQSAHITTPQGSFDPTYVFDKQ
jgi:hypothetical protein